VTLCGAGIVGPAVARGLASKDLEMLVLEDLTRLSASRSNFGLVRVLVKERPLGRIREICERVRLSTLLVTHDIGVIAASANRVGVVYAGLMIE
jgi:ABC-type phosphonate transport system ATPase subunit